MSPSIADRIAVCSWSLKPNSPDDLIDQLKSIGIHKIQLALDPLREGGLWNDTKLKLRDAGLQIVGGMMRSVGEDYSTLQTIQRTGGIVPDETWPQTWTNMLQMVFIAEDLGLDYVMFHAGFLPKDRSQPTFGKLKNRMEQIADAFGQIGARIGLETGQENAQTLIQFLDHVERENVGINFDPANMILYNKDDPVEALQDLVPRVLQCHIKDAVRTKIPGQWGDEVVVGTGDVNWESFLSVLKEAGYEGPLAIEREWGASIEQDICAARDYLLSCEN